MTLVRLEMASSHSPDSATRPRTPGFCRPTEFMTPLATSVMRGWGLPGQGTAEAPFVVMAPKAVTSMKCSNW